MMLSRLSRLKCLNNYHIDFSILHIHVVLLTISVFTLYLVLGLIFFIQNEKGGTCVHKKSTQKEYRMLTLLL